MTRYKIFFRDGDTIHSIDDLWAENGTWDALQAALMEQIHPETEIIGIYTVDEIFLPRSTNLSGGGAHV